MPIALSSTRGETSQSRKLALVDSNQRRASHTAAVEVSDVARSRWTSAAIFAFTGAATAKWPTSEPPASFSKSEADCPSSLMDDTAAIDVMRAFSPGGYL